MGYLDPCPLPPIDGFRSARFGLIYSTLPVKFQHFNRFDERPVMQQSSVLYILLLHLFSGDNLLFSYSFIVGVYCFSGGYFFIAFIHRRLDLRGVFYLLAFLFCICLRAGLDGYFFVLAGKWNLHQQTSKSKKRRGEKKVWERGFGTMDYGLFFCFFLFIGVRILGAVDHLGLVFYCFV